ncbi:2-amino-4-hydroxy-6-hydroxymethyldihydropteridine diphosphokinase [Candidatus Pelagibacter sp.]|nr:2-amino-4-hydroxy-6-hydroxymethyldihydropteridine diphosphokinase [Candidatus Pelagibacter sp.]
MVYIGIGSNLGNRINNIEKAKYFLKLNGIKILRSSSYYETLSWPDPNKPKFINIVIKLNTKISPKKFLEICKSIEKKLGRKIDFKNSPRTCDIDIISYKNIITLGDIIIPHKRMHKRNFVLIPLFEIAPDWVHPKTNESIKKLIFSLPIKDITSIKHI